MTTKIEKYLNEVYDSTKAAQAQTQIASLIERYREQISAPARDELYSQRDVVLITYGDSLRHPGQTPLQSLKSFAMKRLQGVLSAIHILPFYPYSSDDGFSVIDFYAVNPELGTWDDVSALGEDFDLMFDAVFNHMSAQSEWFQRWLTGDPEFAGLFRTESPDTDLSAVTRPRALPLLTEFKRPDGESVHVWTTFSDDQVDFDAATPATVIRLLDALLFYVSMGATIIRLDAIAFLWKEPGTNSIHLPQTHAIIKLMRAVLDEVAPHVILITETNVPHKENVSYFGDGHDEAQMVYNFTLPPLLFHTLLSGDARRLREWINTLKTPSDRTTFFNFTASHDGIGVRPVEGILGKDELDAMIAHVEATGGRVSYKRNSDGTDSPYELNVTYVDAIAGTSASVDVQVARFILSQTIQMSLAGVPAVYIHSLVGSRNDVAGMQAAGINRRINRAKLDRAQVEAALDNPGSFRARVFNEYTRRINIRRAQPAFHPNAPQVALDLGSAAVLGLRRDALNGEQTLLAVFNVSGEAQPMDLSGIFERQAQDLLSGVQLGPRFTLPPYAALWLNLPMV